MSNSECPPFSARPDINQRLQELLPSGAENVKDQHIVSEVLLKQFSQPTPNKGRQLVRFNVMYPDRQPKTRSPKACGKYANFIKYASKSAEEFWWPVENRMDSALTAVREESILGDPEHMSTIRDVIALHFVRSVEILWMHEVAWEATKARSREALLSRPNELLDIFKSYIGLHATGVGALEMLIERIHSDTQELFDSGALLRARIEYLYTETRRLIDHVPLQFARSTGPEFLIGDAPAISLKKNSPYFGIRGGIGLLNADTVYLPLGRRHVVALGKSNSITWVDAKGVSILNRLQILAAKRHVHFHPSSGLTSYARAVSNERLN